MKNQAPEEQPELLQPEELSARLPENIQKLEVEIGCGNGHFLVEYCRINTSILFLGVEIKKKRCLKAQAKIKRQQLGNALIIHGKGEKVLEFLQDESVDSFHLYFPDPWPKTRHRRRRFLRGSNIEKMQKKLKSGGYLFFATDYFDYYLHTKVLLLLQKGLKLSSQRPGKEIFRSVFAQRFTDKGKQIHSLSAQKIGSSANNQVPDQQQEEQIHGQS